MLDRPQLQIGINSREKVRQKVGSAVDIADSVDALTRGDMWLQFRFL
jgi:hypothetical protein